MQVVAVLLTAAGLGALSGAIGGLDWGVGAGGFALFAMSLVFLLDLDGDE